MWWKLGDSTARVPKPKMKVRHWRLAVCCWRTCFHLGRHPLCWALSPVTHSAFSEEVELQAGEESRIVARALPSKAMWPDRPAAAKRVVLGARCLTNIWQVLVVLNTLQEWTSASQLLEPGKGRPTEPPLVVLLVWPPACLQKLPVGRPA